MSELSDTLDYLLSTVDPADPHALSRFLRSVQSSLNWVPPQALELASERLGIAYTRVYEAAALTPVLRLEPVGKNLVRVCHGLACREVGSQDLLKEYCRLAEAKVGAVSPDGLFTIASSSCFGYCAIGANVQINGAVLHGQELKDCAANVAALRAEKPLP